MTRAGAIAGFLVIACATRVGAQQSTRWPEFHADTLKVAFHYPATAGLRIEARAATCAASDRNWEGSIPDSMLVVTRTVAPFVQLAASLGLERNGDRWIAAGYQGTKAPVAFVREGAWEAIVTNQATTVVYDMALRSPAAASQWRFLAIGPAADGCRPVLLAIATGQGVAWDSATVAAVLKSARPHGP